MNNYIYTALCGMATGIIIALLAAIVKNTEPSYGKGYLYDEDSDMCFMSIGPSWMNVPCTPKFCVIAHCKPK